MGIQKIISHLTKFRYLLLGLSKAEREKYISDILNPKPKLSNGLFVTHLEFFNAITKEIPQEIHRKGKAKEVFNNIRDLLITEFASFHDSDVWLDLHALYFELSNLYHNRFAVLYFKDIKQKAAELFANEPELKVKSNTAWDKFLLKNQLTYKDKYPYKSLKENSILTILIALTIALVVYCIYFGASFFHKLDLECLLVNTSLLGTLYGISIQTRNMGFSSSELISSGFSFHEDAFACQDIKEKIDTFLKTCRENKNDHKELPLLKVDSALIKKTAENKTSIEDETTDDKKSMSLAPQLGLFKHTREETKYPNLLSCVTAPEPSKETGLKDNQCKFVHEESKTTYIATLIEENMPRDHFIHIKKCFKKGYRSRNADKEGVTGIVFDKSLQKDEAVKKDDKLKHTRFKLTLSKEARVKCSFVKEEGSIIYINFDTYDRHAHNPKLAKTPKP